MIGSGCKGQHLLTGQGCDRVNRSSTGSSLGCEGEQHFFDAVAT